MDPFCKHVTTHTQISLSGAALGRWADSLDEVDVTIAERRPLDALQALRRVEKMLTRPPSPQSSDPLHKKKVLQGGSLSLWHYDM